MEFTSVIIFMGFCIFGPMFIGICTIRPDPIIVQTEVVKYRYIKPKTSKKLKDKKDKTLVIDEHTNILKEECMKCLRSLGMKKTDAEDKVEQMWKNKNYNSIESFLMDAYRV